MNIYDLRHLSLTDARALVYQTLDQHPILRRIFSEQYIDALIRRRNHENYLLLQLVRPSDEHTQRMWAMIEEDLTLLAPEGSFEHFAAKLRERERDPARSGRNELALAARMKRLGYAISLEDETRNHRLCEFRVGTSPETFWEIKTVSDIATVRDRERVNREIASQLRRLPVPYVVHLEPSSVAMRDVHLAIAEIIQEMVRHHAAGGALPARFTSHGLTLAVHEITHRATGGYLGVTNFGLHVFADEQGGKIADRIKSATAQLPDDAAGIVVIDTSTADWADREDVLTACFGQEAYCYSPSTGADWLQRNGGLFVPDRYTRISAVVHYERHPFEREQSLYVMHNPFARIPLGDDVLAAPDVTQLRVNADGRFAESPPAAPQR
ncbi:MAG: hypothetical protein KGN02_01320 [bacterium]|nr:hypothetical protein [bacterium]